MLSSLKITFCICNLAIACFTHLSLFSLTNATNINGLTIDMIHRNSPISPAYNPSDMKSSRKWFEAYQRSMERAHRFRKISTSKNSTDSEVIPSAEEYYMKISFGSPPIEALAIADTGSDLTWIQCKPCNSCYKQNSTIFDPSKSSTYRKLSCRDKSCLKLKEASCRNKMCHYSYGYQDKSITKGYIAFETITLGSDSRNQISFPKFVMGCGHHNKGIFDPVGAGIVGLGGGPLSLISQLDSTFGGKFSYCLVPPDNIHVSSKIHFGQDTNFAGPGKVSTPLVPKSPSTFYYVTLLGISVGNEKLPLNTLSSTNKRDPLAGKGNMFVDSGTTFTLVPQDLYNRFESSLLRFIRAKRVPAPDDYAEICYKSGDLVDAPIITFHFTGADLKLMPINSFMKLDNGVSCLTIVSSEDNDFGILGNIAQINFEVGYDLKGRTISFVPTDCTKH